MKIVIFTKNWVGDILFELPAIEAIRKNYPDSEILCLTPERCRPVLEAHPDVNRVLTFDEKKQQRSLWSKLKFILKLRKEHADQGYLFHRSKTRAWILWLGGVGERIGFASGRRRLLTCAVPEPEKKMHHVDYFLELVRHAGIQAPDTAEYRFYTPEKERSEIARKLAEKKIDSFVCFHLGANWEPKRWPAEHFARLADFISEVLSVPILVTGAKGDQPLAEEMLFRVGRAKVISWVGETSLTQLSALYEKALFVVTGDSGPMHMASAVGTRVAALFGPTHPDLTGPRGWGEKIIFRYVPRGYEVPWYGKNLPAGGWLSRISPVEVFEKLQKEGWLPPSRHEDAIKTEGISENPSCEGTGPVYGVREILLVTLSNIGDVILTTPVITALANRFPGARITAVCGPRAHSLLEGSRYLYRVLVYNKHASLKKKLRFLRELRRVKYDKVLDLRNSAIPFLVRAGKRSPLIRRFRKTAMRDRHLELLELSRIENPDPSTFDFFHSSDEQSASAILREAGVPGEREWIAVSACAASELKTWKLDGFRQVIAGLLNEFSGDILLVGDTRERTLSAPLTELEPSRVFNIAGQTTLRELAAVLSKASLLLTNDSAAMHLAYELNRPVVAVFGPTDHEKYGRTGPLFRIVREELPCSPCRQPRCRFERQHCFEDLSAEKVLSACRELLRQKAEMNREVSTTK